MYAIDFEYDGRYLSDFDLIVCNFNPSSGAEIVSAGSNLTFNTVPRHQGKKYGLTGTQYDECISVTFDICKNPDRFDPEDMSISRDHYRKIKRWLNRREFLPFRVIDWETENFWYEASFNVEKIMIGEILYGLELTMITNSPFARRREKVKTFDFSDPGDIHVFEDDSDEIGTSYPDVVITCKADGKLSIKNLDNDCFVQINNCKNGETISLFGDTQIIETSNQEHKIFNDFNFEFFSISNSINNRENHIKVSLPCEVVIKYRSIVKDSP